MSDNVLLFQRPSAARPSMEAHPDRCAPGGADPLTTARLLRRELYALTAGEQNCVPVQIIAARIGLPLEIAIGAAVYAHVRGWVVFVAGSRLYRCSPGVPLRSAGAGVAKDEAVGRRAEHGIERRSRSTCICTSTP
jgi:hypothetical protein